MMILLGMENPTYEKILSWMNYGIIWEILFHGTLCGFCLRPVTSDSSQKSPEVTKFLENVPKSDEKRPEDQTWLAGKSMIFSLTGGGLSITMIKNAGG